jgi:thioredoxin 1
MIKTGNSENLDTLIQSNGKTLLDFWAPWCGPCQMMMPILDKISSEKEDVQIVKINVEDNPDLAAKYNVSALPTFVVFQDGIEAKRSVGGNTNLYDLVKD